MCVTHILRLYVGIVRYPHYMGMICIAYSMGIICVMHRIICHLCNAAYNMFTTFTTLYHVIYALYIPLNTTTYNVPSLYA